jgi:hypothetical protein
MPIRTLQHSWAEELATLPKPQWLLDGILPQQGFVALISDPGEGKSFLAIDWSLSIASGKDWHGRSVSQGSVAYVMGEGTLGMGPRFEAWQVARGPLPANQLLAIREPVQLHIPGEVESLQAVLDQLNVSPRLIVFDTFSRCFVGGEENSAKDAGEWIQGALRLQQRYSATVLLLHHLTKGKKDLRGSGALKGAADAVIKLKKSKGGIITASCEKQKEAEPFDAFSMLMRSVPEAESVILEPASRTMVAYSVNEGTSKTLQALLDLGPTATSREWRMRTGLAERTFHNHRVELIESGLVYELEGRYSVTASGESALTAKALPSVAKAA